MQAILRFRVLLAGGVALAAALLVATPAPARAADGPPVVGCTTGSSCFVQLNYYIQYTGSSGGNNGVTVPPPRCIAVPVGDAHSGSQLIIGLYGTTAPAPPTTTPTPTASATATGTASATPTASPTPSAAPGLSPAELQIFHQAEGLVNSNPITPGEWYAVDANPYVTSAASAVCSTLPPYVFANAQLPVEHGLHIPPATLAGLAYSQLTTPSFGQLMLNPQGTSDTNLPTFVDVVLNPPRYCTGTAANPVCRTGVLSYYQDANKKDVPYVYATATAPDGTSATVYAKPTALTIVPGSSSATAWGNNSATCIEAQAVPNPENLPGLANKVMVGSQEYVNASKYGAGQQIDCGVTYTAPGSFQLQVNLGWTACWAPGPVDPNGPPADCNTHFNGAGGLQPSALNPTPTVNVREIQSVNNG
jgi:hypothetical protein